MKFGAVQSNPRVFALREKLLGDLNTAVRLR